LDAEQRTEWRLSGKLPEPKADTPSEPEKPESLPSPAESAPAQPVEQVASTDASSPAASEPATPKKANADTRVKDLLAERHALRQELEALKRQSAQPQTPLKAESSPAAAKTNEFPGFDTWQQSNPDGQYDEYLIAKVKHVTALERAAERQQAEQSRITAQRQERTGAFLKRFDDAVAANPTLTDTLNPAVLAIRPVDALGPDEPVMALNLVAQEIMESEQSVQLLAHLSAHPEELDALSMLTSPVAVVRRMAKLEAQLSAPAIPPRKTVSTAPALTTTLGSRPAVPGDALESAKRSGDFSKFRDLANQRDIAAMGIK